MTVAARAFFLFFLIFAMGHALAQSAGPAGAAGAVAKPGLSQPVAISDMLASVDDDLQRVDRASLLIASGDRIAGLERALDDITQSVQGALRVTNDSGVRALPVMRLESLSRHWAFNARRFEQWEAQARAMLAPYGESALQLAQRRSAWSVARAQGLMEALPAVLSSRVQALTTRIDSVELELGDVLTRQFRLQQRASELKAQIAAGQANVAAAIDDLDRRLLQADVPPLWRTTLLPHPAESPTGQSAVDRGLDIESQFAVDYHRAGTANQQAQRILQIGLLPLILWVSLRARRQRAAGELSGNVSRALQRPISAWLLLAALSVLILQPDAPLLVEECVLLLALIPVLRLLPAGMFQALGGWPYVAVALYVVDRLGVAAVADVGLYRLFILVLSCVAIGLTVWLLRHARFAHWRQAGGLPRAIHFLGWVVAGMLVVAVVANVSGNISLAEMLTSGVIDSGYMALLLYTTVIVSTSLLAAVLTQPVLAQRRLVQRHSSVVQAVCVRLMVVAAVVGWALYTLDRFRLLRPLHHASDGILGFGIDVGEVSIHVGDILIFFISVWLALWTARAVRRLLRDELPLHAGLPRGADNSIASLSYYGVLMLGVLVALSAAGFKVSQLALIFGALGVGIGFGLQSLVSNFVSGLVLMFERPIKPGDVVEAAGSSGTVRQIGLRATVIRNFEGADVVVPNGVLLSGNLTNWTLFDRRRRIEIAVGVGYGSQPEHVRSVLLSAAADTPDVDKDPEPAAWMTGYSDSSLDFKLWVWTNDLSLVGRVRGDLLARVLKGLDAEGISIPYPQMDLHLHDERGDAIPSAPPVSG